jgi:hypothetical protein
MARVGHSGINSSRAPERPRRAPIAFGEPPVRQKQEARAAHSPSMRGCGFSWATLDGLRQGRRLDRHLVHPRALPRQCSSARRVGRASRAAQAVCPTAASGRASAGAYRCAPPRSRVTAGFGSVPTRERRGTSGRDLALQDLGLDDLALDGLAIRRSLPPAATPFIGFRSTAAHLPVDSTK